MQLSLPGCRQASYYLVAAKTRVPQPCTACQAPVPALRELPACKTRGQQGSAVLSSPCLNPGHCGTEQNCGEEGGWEGVLAEQRQNLCPRPHFLGTNRGAATFNRLVGRLWPPPFAASAADASGGSSAAGTHPTLAAAECCPFPRLGLEASSICLSPGLAPAPPCWCPPLRSSAAAGAGPGAVVALPVCLVADVAVVKGESALRDPGFICASAAAIPELGASWAAPPPISASCRCPATLSETWTALPSGVGDSLLRSHSRVPS